MKNRTFPSRLLSIYKALQNIFDPATEGNPYEPYKMVSFRRQSKETISLWPIKRWAVR